MRPDPAGLLDLQPRTGGVGLAFPERVPVEFHDNVKDAYRRGVSPRALADWLTGNGMKVSSAAVSKWLQSEKVVR